MNLWHDVFPGTNLNKLKAIVEIARGSKNKYELDKETGLLKLNRVLRAAFHYPLNYGFIPQTLYKDGDAIDILIMGRPIDPKVLVEVRPVAILIMNDGNKEDSKILSVPLGDPMVNTIKDIKHVPPELLKEIAHFFKHYKDLEGKKVKIRGWKNARKAKIEILKSILDYKRKFKS